MVWLLSPSILPGWQDFMGKERGMNQRINPRDFWKTVVTVYDDADKIVEFLASEDPLNARVVMLGEERQVQFIDDRGFSVAALNEFAKFFPRGKNKEV